MIVINKYIKEKYLRVFVYFVCIFFAYQIKEISANDNIDYIKIKDDEENKAYIYRADNNTPIININSPKNDISVNYYESFNINNENLILNNHKGESVYTTFGGEINGNTNFKGNDNPAKIIINEVITDTLSNINGGLEVAGSRADVIIANPNGILINNGEFLNINRLSMITGSSFDKENNSSFDSKGNLNTFKINNEENNIIATNLITKNGDIGIVGINLLDVKYADFVSRVINSNLNIDGDAVINIKTGNHEAKYGENGFSVISKENNKNKISINSSLFGLIRGKQINFIATENGVGVDIKNSLVSTTDDINFDVNGNILIAENGILNSHKNINIKTGYLENKGSIIANNSMKINSNNNIDNLYNAKIENKNGNAEFKIYAGNNFKNIGGIIKAKSKETSVIEAKKDIILLKLHEVNLLSKNTEIINNFIENLNIEFENIDKEIDNFNYKIIDFKSDFDINKFDLNLIGNNYLNNYDFLQKTDITSSNNLDIIAGNEVKISDNIASNGNLNIKSNDKNISIIPSVVVNNKNNEYSIKYYPINISVGNSLKMRSKDNISINYVDINSKKDITLESNTVDFNNLYVANTEIGDGLFSITNNISNLKIENGNLNIKAKNNIEIYLADIELKNGSFLINNKETNVNLLPKYDLEINNKENPAILWGGDTINSGTLADDKEDLDSSDNLDYLNKKMEKIKEKKEASLYVGHSIFKISNKFNFNLTPKVNTINVSNINFNVNNIINFGNNIIAKNDIIFKTKENFISKEAHSVNLSYEYINDNVGSLGISAGSKALDIISRIYKYFTVSDEYFDKISELESKGTDVSSANSISSSFSYYYSITNIFTQVYNSFGGYQNIISVLGNTYNTIKDIKDIIFVSGIVNYSNITENKYSLATTPTNNYIKATNNITINSNDNIEQSNNVYSDNGTVFLKASNNININENSIYSAKVKNKQEFNFKGGYGTSGIVAGFGYNTNSKSDNSNEIVNTQIVANNVIIDAGNNIELNGTNILNNKKSTNSAIDIRAENNLDLKSTEDKLNHNSNTFGAKLLKIGPTNASYINKNKTLKKNNINKAASIIGNNIINIAAKNISSEAGEIKSKNNKLFVEADILKESSINNTNINKTYNFQISTKFERITDLEDRVYNIFQNIYNPSKAYKTKLNNMDLLINKENSVKSNIYDKNNKNLKINNIDNENNKEHTLNKLEKGIGIFLNK